ncbi:MAG TPA: hypothetical protein VGF95_03345 [Solirubrobacteraceae bacterium]|jgi:Rod binding domain-containing protein
MSALGISSTQLPVVSTSLEPESVRNGSTAVKNAYQEGLSFEEMLTEELTKSLTEMGGLGEGEGSEGAEGEESSGGALGAGGNSLVSSLLPQALAQGVTAGGGLGLATQLANGVAANEGAATAGTMQAAGAAAPSGATVTSAMDISGAAGGAVA